MAESQFFGKVKYRCPNCGYVMNCQLNAPQKFVVPARSVIPVTNNSLAYDSNGNRLQLVETEIIRKPLETGGFSLVATGEVSRQKPHSFIKRIWNAVVWLWAHLEVFFSWSSDRISKFREKYEDADLWLFFGFSLLFVIAVFLGLFVCAELTKLIVSGQSWLFKTYLQIIH